MELVVTDRCHEPCHVIIESLQAHWARGYLEGAGGGWGEGVGGGGGGVAGAADVDVLDKSEPGVLIHLFSHNKCKNVRLRGGLQE